MLHTDTLLRVFVFVYVFLHTRCGVLCHPNRVERGSESRAIRKNANPLASQLLRRPPVEAR